MSLPDLPSGGIQRPCWRKGRYRRQKQPEGVQGFYYVYHGNCYSRDILVGELGTRFESEISRSPYPRRRGTHPTIDATLTPCVRISRRTMESIKLPPGTLTRRCRQGRRSLAISVDSQFSSYCATAIVKKRVTLSSYTETAIREKDVRRRGKGQRRVRTEIRHRV